MSDRIPLPQTALRIVIALGLALALMLSIGSPVAAQEEAREAQVSVLLTDLGFEFGAIGPWEASLYAGATVGEETAGRFTQWLPVEDGQVTLLIPDDLVEDADVPWDAADDTYVRLRTTGDDAYPTLDVVSEPFTLAERLYTVLFDFEHAVTRQAADVTAVEIALGWGMADFGDVTAWEGSMYEGPMVGEETSGRFTEWIESPDGFVVISIPDDVREDAEAPFDVEEGIYARIRSTDDAYPAFDMFGVPFILTENEITTVMFTLARSVSDEPLPVTPPVVAPPVDRPPVPLPEDPEGYAVYTVVAGDTLGNIAFRAYGDATRFPEIVAATNALTAVDETLNTIVNPNMISIGWRVAIPGPQFLPDRVVDVDEEVVVPVPTDLRTLVGDRGGAFDTFQVSYPTTTEVMVTLEFAPADPIVTPGVGFNIWGEGELIAEGELIEGTGPREATFTALAGEAYEIQVYNYIHGELITYRLIVSP